MASIDGMKTSLKKVQKNNSDEIEKVYLTIDKNLKRVINNEVNISHLQL